MTELLKLLGPTASSYDKGIFMDEFSTLVDWLEKAGDADELKNEMKVSKHPWHPLHCRSFYVLLTRS